MPSIIQNSLSYKQDNVFNGVTTGSVTNIQTTVASDKIYLKWEDPTDMILSGNTISKWNGTLLIRKVGGYPQNELDGIKIIDSKIRNAYKNTAYIDNNIVAGTVYYYRFFPYTIENKFDYSSYNVIQCVPTSIELNPVFSENSWDNIVYACETHTVPETWAYADIKEIPINGNEHSNMFFGICGKEIDMLADGSGTAALTLCATSPLMFADVVPSDIYPWTQSNLKQSLLIQISNIDNPLRDAIKEVSKKTRVCFTNDGINEIITTDETAWIFSGREVGSNDIEEGFTYPVFSSDQNRIMSDTRYFTRSEKRNISDMYAVPGISVSETGVIDEYANYELGQSLPPTCRYLVGFCI